MARSNGRLTEKQVAEWFDALNFESQRLVLGSFAASHGKVREKRISELRRELDALEEKPAAGRRAMQTAAIKVKYRDPKTNETWSGRGRMANWLAAKVKAGEKAARYLVR